MTIKIEKGVPIPIEYSKYGVLKDMEVGDSVFVEGQTQNAVCSATRHYTKTGKKFTCRIVEGGVRLWRIK